MAKPRVLVVDDEPDLVELVELTLARMNLATATALTLGDARRHLQTGSFDLCLCDMRLPDGDGLDLLEWVQANRPALPMAIITAHGNVETAVRALKSGAFDFVTKPLDLGELRRLVMRALKIGEAVPATGSPPRGPVLLGHSAPMQQLRQMIERVARSQAPVHIFGESGTGKELVARLIHQSGPRADGPFTAVNCGAIPSELMESEFFGHKRGSFTGAVADSRGLLQASEGGTLFLDEVAELPLHMQVKLLRVIQEKTVRPLGESGEVPVDVRVLSATHRDLRSLVAEGRFREDLYYRINVIELKVPPLRERPGDIEALAQAVLARLAARGDHSSPSLTPEALRALRDHAFPGNVRELENVLERAYTLSDGRLITRDDLQLRAAATADEDDGSDDALDDQLTSIEREAIVRALQQSRYNKTAAAKLLGISFRTLRYRIKKLGIE